MCRKSRSQHILLLSADEWNGKNSFRKVKKQIYFSDLLSNPSPKNGKNRWMTSTEYIWKRLGTFGSKFLPLTQFSHLDINRNNNRYLIDTIDGTHML